MMSKNIGLYPHNWESYKKIKKAFLSQNVVSIIHATGTGKSYNALQLAYDNPNWKIIYLVPSKSIVEHIKDVIQNNLHLDVNKDFGHIEFRTYQSLINLSQEELKSLPVDLLVADEFHHTGAPVWGDRIQTIMDTHPQLKILGMSAYTTRSRNTTHEQNLIDEESNNIFANSVVSRYELVDAFIDEVLPRPIYKSGYLFCNQTINELEKKVNKLDKQSNQYKELLPLIIDVKNKIHSAGGVKDIFLKNIKKNGKYIYFCPFNSVDEESDVLTIMQEVKKWLVESGLQENDFQLYTSISKMGNFGKNNREAFYNDCDLNHKKVDHKLRIMFAVNQYNEGVHVPGIDGVIMARSTNSDIVYFEQLGRALAVGVNYKKEYDSLMQKTIEELQDSCLKRNINLNKEVTKEELVQLLLSPVIIDLVNNISFIQELENSYNDIIKTTRRYGEKQNDYELLNSVKFSVDMINQEIFDIFEYLKDRLIKTWEDMLDLVSIYKNVNNSVDIPKTFKTINGYEYDENGVQLGLWLSRQKYLNKKNELKENRKEKLQALGVDLSVVSADERWDDYYNLAENFFIHYNHLKVPNDFKTSNGYEYDENGKRLGRWVARQKEKFKKNTLDEQHVVMLQKIKMDLSTKNRKVEWMKKYILVKEYYNHFGNLNIPHNFKTKNGFEYDEDGLNIDLWLSKQKLAFNKKSANKITDEEIKLLEKLGMDFTIKNKENEWQRKYELAKKYYEKNGNLNVSKTFLTDDGDSLYNWLTVQIRNYKKNPEDFEEEKLEMLKAIGIELEGSKRARAWQNNYDLAKKYFEHYGNLQIPDKFKTSNGYEYDEKGVNLGTWLSNQKQRYLNNRMELERVTLLENIGAKFNVKDFVLEWQQKYQLAKNYYEHFGNLNVPDKFKTKNGYEFDEQGINLDAWIYHQRRNYKDDKLNDEQIKMLEAIEMRFESKKRGK